MPAPQLAAKRCQQSGRGLGKRSLLFTSRLPKQAAAGERPPPGEHAL